MGQVIKTKIIKIGNSQGIRIPKLIVEQVGLGEEVELEIQEGQILLHPVKQPRQGWEEQFKKMVELGDDVLLDAETASTDWDEKEWEW